MTGPEHRRLVAVRRARQVLADTAAVLAAPRFPIEDEEKMRRELDQWRAGRERSASVERAMSGTEREVIVPEKSAPALLADMRRIAAEEAARRGDAVRDGVAGATVEIFKEERVRLAAELAERDARIEALDRQVGALQTRIDTLFAALANSRS